MNMLWDMFLKGGPLMWPILALSVVAGAVAIEKAFALRRKNIVPEKTVARLLDLTRKGQINEAAEVARHDGGPFARVALAGFEWWGHGPEAVKEAIEDSGRRVAPLLRRGLGVIGTVASVSPLLGLLGTVTGMIRVFRTISLTGPGQGQELSGGIAEALLTTAFGLAVAIPALIVYNLLDSRAERLILDVESGCHEIVRQAGQPVGDAS